MKTCTSTGSEGSITEYKCSDGYEIHLYPMFAIKVYPKEMNKFEDMLTLEEALDFIHEYLHTVHVEVRRNPDGTPYFDTYYINDTIPKGREEDDRTGTNK